MNTFEIIISIGVLLLLVVFINILISGPDKNFNSAQPSMKGKVHKYTPLLVVLILFVSILSSYIYYRIRDNRKAKEYSMIKEKYETAYATIDSILETPGMDTSLVAQSIREELDTLVSQKRKLEHLQEQSAVQEKFTGKTKIIDSIQILDRDYERKIKYLENKKKVKVYRNGNYKENKEL
ncbi:MAG: hypothetical protein IPM34_00860 [Saprospiraceae bacterium]|nr:hypothetical protein [Saprospiraceae bacterium]